MVDVDDVAQDCVVNEELVEEAVVRGVPKDVAGGEEDGFVDALGRDYGSAHGPHIFQCCCERLFAEYMEV